MDIFYFISFHFSSVSLKILWLPWLLIPDSLLVHLWSGNCHLTMQCERFMSFTIAVLIPLCILCFLTSYGLLMSSHNQYHSNVYNRFALETTEEKYCISLLFSAADESGTRPLIPSIRADGHLLYVLIYKWNSEIHLALSAFIMYYWSLFI